VSSEYGPAGTNPTEESVWGVLGRVGGVVRLPVASVVDVRFVTAVIVVVRQSLGDGGLERLDVECGVVRLADHRRTGESIGVAVGDHDRLATLDGLSRAALRALVVERIGIKEPLARESGVPRSGHSGLVDEIVIHTTSAGGRRKTPPLSGGGKRRIARRVVDR